MDSWSLVESFVDPTNLPWKKNGGVDEEYPYVPLFANPIRNGKNMWKNSNWQFYGSWADQGAALYYFFLYLKDGGFIDPNDQDHELIHFIGVHKPWINLVDQHDNEVLVHARFDDF